MLWPVINVLLYALEFIDLFDVDVPSISSNHQVMDALIGSDEVRLIKTPSQELTRVLLIILLIAGCLESISIVRFSAVNWQLLELSHTKAAIETHPSVLFNWLSLAVVQFISISYIVKLVTLFVPVTALV